MKNGKLQKRPRSKSYLLLGKGGNYLNKKKEKFFKKFEFYFIYKEFELVTHIYSLALRPTPLTIGLILEKKNFLSFPPFHSLTNKPYRVLELNKN